MRCPRCDADTPDGAKFCIECGTRLKPRCPQCGADTQPRAKLCANCGTPLTAQTPARSTPPPPSPLRYTPGYLAEKILHSRSALEGECKQVTVLFAAPERSLAWLADREPDDARPLLESGFERTVGVVRPHEGVVNRGGDHWWPACFGAPITHVGMRREPASQPCASNGTAGTTRPARPWGRTHYSSAGRAEAAGPWSEARSAA
jgi:hypothetical protein